MLHQIKRYRNTCSPINDGVTSSKKLLGFSQQFLYLCLHCNPNLGYPAFTQDLMKKGVFAGVGMEMMP